jgi:hypothetical protein
MKKVIALSVWGPNIRYRVGALKNIELSKTLFPDWEIYLYTDNTNWVTSKHDGLKTIQMHSYGNWDGLFWRFIPFFDTEGFVLSRDADSRLSEREKKAVDEWIQSGKSFSIIRDHIRHFDFPMLGGMWGAKTPLNKDLIQKFNGIKNRNHYAANQEFLAVEVWPIVQNDVFIHEMSSGWFKKERDSVGANFVGQGYDENDNPIYPKN